ncbi:discoidin domain-containing protein [Rubripirellula tenax]|nr:discoidin domain-containing protein [Rubripirellula tenax]
MGAPFFQTIRFAALLCACVTSLPAGADMPVTPAPTPPQSSAQIDLSGSWEVVLDRQRVFDPSLAQSELSPSRDGVATVRIPGALRDSDLGDLVGPETKWIGGIQERVWSQPRFDPYRGADNFKVPFWLQPERHYVGVAWYRRRIEIPPSWNGKRITLHMERPHWRTHVWIDDDHIGDGESLSTPQQFVVTDSATTGSHWLTIGVDNSLDNIDVGFNSHSVSDHTQTAWNGIVGNVSLIADTKLSVARVDVNAIPGDSSVRATIHIANDTEYRQQASVRLRISRDDEDREVDGEAVVDVDVPVGSSVIDAEVEWTRTPEHWNEFSPVVYRLTTSIESPVEEDAESEVAVARKHTTTFGVRSIESIDGALRLNGQPIFLRGTLESCVFPLTGYPPTDLPSWQRILRICRDHGLNHLRFHSWCPPESAFVAADQMGFYFHVDCSSWPNTSTQLGIDRPVDAWLYREAERIIASFGNHPSLILISAGNEPGGPESGADFLGRWVSHFKSKENRILFSGGVGWPQIPENEFFVAPRPRLHQWGQGVASRLNAEEPNTTADYGTFVESIASPIISHEIGQWCVYPNLAETTKYTGVLKAKNFEIFRDFLDSASMGDQADDFLMASGKLQSICYKEEIEACLRTEKLDGFQMLDLHDFPGQGSAVVGVLDAFWDPKPYIDAAEFRKFCGPTVPLARMPRRVWNNAMLFVADVEVSHYGPSPFTDVVPRWQIRRGEEVLASGELAKQTIVAAGLRRIGRLEWPLDNIKQACELTLSVSLPPATSNDRPIENDWRFWVYPEGSRSDESITGSQSDLVVTHSLDEKSIKGLQAGKRVVWLARPSLVKTDFTIGFSPIFWNTAWTNGQSPHTLGVLCDPAHAALRDFPTRFHSDWQWWELISQSAAMRIDQLPGDVETIVQVVPDWSRPKRLALAIEAKVGAGKLIVCSIDLETDLDRRPAANQFRQSLMKYAASDDFEPNASVTVEQLSKLFRKPSPLESMGTIVTSSSFQAGYGPALAIDEDPKTFWHVNWSNGVAKFPHWLMVDLKEARPVSGIHVQPRVDRGRSRIADFEIQVSSDGERWVSAASGTWGNSPAKQSVRFDRVRNVRFVKLISKRSHEHVEQSSIAEVEVSFENPTALSGAANGSETYNEIPAEGQGE